jgi:cytochrome c6
MTAGHEKAVEYLAQSPCSFFALLLIWKCNFRTADPAKSQLVDAGAGGLYIPGLRRLMKTKLGFGFTFLLVGVGLLASFFAFRAAVPADSGETVFKSNCVMCHGADGKGFAALKTPDFTSPKWQASMTDKQMRAVIKDGKKGTAMAAFGDKLSDEQITAVIAYIRSLKKK